MSTIQHQDLQLVIHVNATEKRVVLILPEKARQLYRYLVQLYSVQVEEMGTILYTPID